jgi:hypothetical protein
MYIITDRKTGRVLRTGLSRSEMQGIINTSMDFAEDSEHGVVTIGMKYDKSSNSFVDMTDSDVRDIRAKILKDTDWRATVDYPNTDQSAWLEYRQALRDMPQNSSVVFPQSPEGV